MSRQARLPVPWSPRRTPLSHPSHPSRRAPRRLRLPIGIALVGGLVATLVGSVPVSATAAPPLAPDPERTSQTVTPWGWHANATPAQVKSFVSKGNRIVDLEVRPTGSLRLDVSYVKNAGTYARGWWWYHGQTGVQVQAKLAQHKARLIDIEPYSTKAGTRYAVVMVANTGVAKKAWAWYANAPLSTITAYAKKHKMRVIDAERHASGSRFSAVLIRNTGVDAKQWWHYYNVTFAQARQLQKKHKARPINLERLPSGRYDLVLQRQAGEYWWWRIGATPAQVAKDANQFGARVFQLKGYKKGSTVRYDALYLNNVNAETRRVAASAAGMKGDWGFYLKRVGGSESLALGENIVFEPASMIKIVHAVTAMREIQTTATNPGTHVAWFAHPDNPARNPGDPNYDTDKNKCAYDGSGNHLTDVTYADDLGPVVVRQMMVWSDNRNTDALTRRYGFAKLNATAQMAGMSSSAIHHRIGCPGAASPQPRKANELTLRDAGRIYERVENRTLLNTTHRDLLYDYMAGGAAGGALGTMIEQESVAAGLTATERQQFRTRVERRSKGGSYTTCTNADGGQCQLRRTTGGIIWLPFRSGGSVTDRPYVYGHYFDLSTACTLTTVNNGQCAQLNTNTAARAKVAVEMFRAEVKKALATW